MPFAFGRVQSVAVKLIVERERAIRVFKPEEYWTVEASLAQYTDPKIQTNDRLLKSVVFQVTKKNNKPFRPRSESEVNSDIASMQEKTFVVSGQTRQLRKVSAPPPLITTTLQRVAASNLGYPVGLTMRLAQRLYESGHITYMRTDSTNLSNESISSVREYISTNIQEPYSKSNRESKHNFLPLKPQHYGSKKTAQEAHEAIRPTDVNLNPTRFPNPSSQEARLYQLIWQRFIASQMSKYEFATYTTTVSAGEYDLSITRRQTIFDGWRKIIPLPQRDDEQPLLERPYDDGEMLACLEVTKKQHFTKPPARFSEARLVKELEDRGIGRPSTYASIISTIKDRGYVTLKGKQFHAERIGEIVTDRLEESFTNLLDYEFTSKLESKLDEIAHGNDDWLSVLDGFYESFSEQLTTAESPDGMQRNSPVKTDINCVKCNGEMLLRVARNGTFLGCENFSAKEPNQCNFTLNLFPDSEFEAIDEAGSEESMRLLEKRPCPICGTGMDPQIIDESRRIHICGNTPNCTGVIVEHGSFKIKGYDGPKVECNKCQSDMQLETGRFGKYFKCSNDECTNTRKLLRNGDVAPVRADPVPMPELTCEKNPDHFVLREGGAGIFLAASQYPRHRETRAPLIRELKGHGNRLDPKFKYLLNAPEADSKGNPSQVRWSRKFGEQYLSSEKKGKDTGWRAYFQEGRWVVIEPKRKSRSKAKAAA